MDTNTQPYVAPPGITTPITSVADAVNQINQASNTPQVQTAANNVNSAMTAAQQSNQADYTLPQLLQNALIPGLGQTSSGAVDPDVAKSTADLGQYLGDLSNPQRLLEGVAPEGVVLSPQQQRDIISGRLGSEAANINQNNFLAGLRSGGFGTIINNLTRSHLLQTQKLQDAASLAKEIYSQALSGAQLHISAAQAMGQMLQAQNELAFQKQTNPLLNATAAHQEMEDAAPTLTFDQFAGKFGTDPRLQGMTPTQLYTTYKNAGGKGELTAQDIRNYPELKGINPVLSGQTSVTGWLGNLQGLGQGIAQTGSAVAGAVPTVSMLARLLRGAGPLAEEIGLGAAAL